MSAELANQAAVQAGFLSNARRQVFQSVPPVPPGIDLAGKTVLVTGSNVGLGLESARHFLALRPNRLIMAVRSLQRGEAAAKPLRAEFPHVQIGVWELDMERFTSVQAFATRCEKELERLHVAVLNAGVGKTKFERTKEGRHREATLQVNYLSTALLAMLLIPKMKPSASSPEPGRLTIITSDAALGVKPEDPGEAGLLNFYDRPEGYEGFKQYAVSKLMIVAFGIKLAEAVGPDQVIINCSNPGATKGTAFLSNVDSWAIKAVFGILHTTLGRTAVDAARIYVHAALVLGKESHGSYTDWLVRAWPVMMYGDNGPLIRDRLWSETLEELSAAGYHFDLNGAKS